MSNTCTVAKHGVDPNAIHGWYSANLDFRRDQCAKLIDSCRELEKQNAITYIGFKQFTSDMSSTVRHVYRRLGMSMSSEYSEYLRKMQIKQETRVAGYTNDHCDTSGFEEFSDFVKSVNNSPQEALQA